MKSLVLLALVAITGVSAVTAAVPTASQPVDGDKDCLANYIVRQCLQSQNDRPTTSAGATQPKPLRRATQAMNGACMDASARATTTTRAVLATTTAKTTTVVTTTSASTPDVSTTSTTTSAAASASKTNGAETLAGNAVGMLAAVAGAVAVVL
ncbi:GPI anchored serine-threonine rich protein [Metarhizium rileyi]|uniref:GPI anchored serine-threonine rich protein n=1 Tax=Metarhizium rileyi (strain RCEF 4871) TaxID=1649241 RepID=A0A167DAE2_METRR|nr:GPI anchored serine-threonine rich protein [Metarhizium rileyi RCEF 4871]